MKSITNKSQISDKLQDEILMFQDIIDRILYLPEDKRIKFISDIKNVNSKYQTRSTKIIYDDEKIETE